MLIRMDLARTIIMETSDSQVIVLKERDGERQLPILIGMNEALAIDRRLKGLRTPRPMTHDLLQDLIERLECELERIVISDLREHTFFATLVIGRDGQTIEVDSRPSDAIALGVAGGTPIFVESHVLEEASRNA
jgi:bifunctional DNase/RNase